MSENIALALNSVDLLKHVLYKDYVFPTELGNLNLTQERILMTVKNANDLPMVTIARAIGLEKGPFSQTVDKLEQLDLLTRVRSNTDKRLVFLRLTSKGEQLTQVVVASMEAHFRVKTSKLSSAELGDLLHALSILKKTANLLISK